MKVGVNGGGEGSKHIKTVMKGEGGGATGSVGEDWVDSCERPRPRPVF